MTLNTIREIEEFKEIAENAHGSIWAEDMEGNRYDLRNEITQYEVIGKLLQDNDLELFTNNANDENNLLKFLKRMKKAA